MRLPDTGPAGPTHTHTFPDPGSVLIPVRRPAAPTLSADTQTPSGPFHQPARRRGMPAGDKLDTHNSSNTLAPLNAPNTRPAARAPSVFAFVFRAFNVSPHYFLPHTRHRPPDTL